MKNVILLTALLASVSSSESLKMYMQRKKKASCPAIQEGCCTDLEESYMSKWFFDICIPKENGRSMMYKYRKTQPRVILPPMLGRMTQEDIPEKIDVGQVEFESNDCSGPIDSISVVESGVRTDTCDSEFKYDLVELSDEDVAGLYAVVVVPQPRSSDALCNTFPTLAAWFQNTETPEVFGALIGSGPICMDGDDNRTGFDGNGNILLYPEDNCQGTPTTSVTCLARSDEGSVGYSGKVSEYLAAYEARVGNALGKQTYSLGVFKQYAEETCETEIGFGGNTMYGFCIPSGDGVSSKQVFYMGKNDQILARRLEDEEEFFPFLIQDVQYQDPKCASLPLSARARLVSSSCNNGARFFPKPIELNDLSPELDTVGVGLRAYMNGSYWTPTVCQDKYESTSLKEAVARPDITAINGFTFFSSDVCVNEGSVRRSTGYLSFRTSADGNLTYYANVNCTGAVNEELSGVCNTAEYNENWNPGYYTAAPDFDFYLGTTLREFAHFLAPDMFSERLLTEAPTLAPTTPTTSGSEGGGSPSAAPHVVSVSMFLATIVVIFVGSI